MRKQMLLAGLLAFAVLLVPAYAQEDTGKAKSSAELTNDADRISYAIGAQIGRSLKDAPVDLNLDMFMTAIQDSLAGKELAMDAAEVQKTMMDFQNKMRTAQQEKRTAQGAEQAALGKAFLEENKGKEGVTTLDSGLQYKVLQEGSGDSPGPSDRVKVHYKGTLIDGTQFDSSLDRGEPAVFGVGQVIKGWTEALQLMKTGGKWQVFIPSDLGYGPNGQRNIPPNAVLIFEVELIEIVSKGEVTIPQ